MRVDRGGPGGIITIPWSLQQTRREFLNEPNLAMTGTLSLRLAVGH